MFIKMSVSIKYNHTIVKSKLQPFFLQKKKVKKKNHLWYCGTHGYGPLTLCSGFSIDWSVFSIASSVITFPLSPFPWIPRAAICKSEVTEGRNYGTRNAIIIIWVVFICANSGKQPFLRIHKPHGHFCAFFKIPIRSQSGI